jgi:hypothetical protein
MSKEALEEIKAAVSEYLRGPIGHKDLIGIYNDYKEA